MHKTDVFQESQARGTFDFPLEYYFVDKSHPRYQMPFHWHIEYELILIRQGSFTLRLDTETLQLSAGDAVLIPDGYIHGGVADDCVYECVVFDFTRFLQESTIAKQSLMQAMTETIFNHHLFKEGSKAQSLVEAIMVQMRNRPFGYELVVNGLLWQLMGSIIDRNAITGTSSSTKDWRRIDQIKQVLRRIRKDYALDLKLKDLADDAKLAPKYLCRIFRAVTGRTPIEYLNYYRIECAAEKLIVTTDPVTEIAFGCGFNDLSYFSKTFKRYKGVSARDFRQNAVQLDEQGNSTSKPKKIPM